MVFTTLSLKDYYLMFQLRKLLTISSNLEMILNLVFSSSGFSLNFYNK